MYDLILRDATIVTSAGREVADVAIQDGKIAYVGPRPPKRRTRAELSAIGKFLMPGVIDTAVQFDPSADPEVWERESRAAVSGGVTTVITLPTGRNPVIDRATANARLRRAAGHSWCNFGLWGAATETNAEELAKAAAEHLIVGNLAYLTDTPNGVGIRPDRLESHMRYSGVLAVQLEELIDAPDERRRGEMQKIMTAVRNHDRNVHLVHLSTAEELQMLDPVRGDVPLTAGVTPHHLFLSHENVEGAPVQTRPPVRNEHDRRTLWTAVKRGRLDCVASDHHAAEPGTGDGVPGTELLFPLMLSAVKYGRLSLELLVSLCSEAPARIFGLEGKGVIERGADADLVLFAEGEVSRVNGSSLLSGAGWSPYDRREAAPKPDLVIVGGRITARRGELVADVPNGEPVRTHAIA